MRRFLRFPFAPLLRALPSLALLAAFTGLLSGPFTTLPFSPALLHAQSVQAYTVPYTGCAATVSANSTGTNGFTTAGVGLTPVAQASTSNSGTNTHTFVCDITPPGSISPGVTITDVVFYYGVYGACNLGTQTSNAAAGTFNSTTVFTKILAPTPASSQTPSTLAQLTRADSGSITFTPTTSGFNTASATAGTFYSIKFALGTALTIADLTKYYLNVTLTLPATTACITGTPGLIVHLQ